MILLSRRTFCAGISAAAVAPGAEARTAGFDAVVRKAGGTHSSLAEALAAAPPGDSPYRVLLGRGRWEERITVSRANVAIVGEDRRGSVLRAAVASGLAKPPGGTWGTYGSATLTVEAPGFSASKLTVENSFDYRANMMSQAVKDAQAVPLLLGRGADRSVIDDCDLLGHQDTFHPREGRALVRGCLVAGHVDFIFGGAAVLFEGCEIRTRLRPGEALQGYVAAPSTPRTQPYGLVFDRCRLTREAGVQNASTWLGRPWRSGGNTELLGHAAFLDCWMDGHIHPDGWTWMGYRGPGGYPVRLEPGDARLFEHGSGGPGARRSPSRRQLSAAEAGRCRRDVLAGWQPA
ncbi:MAG TPA: pectinesterase family protein [Allosphingosinicella sp.]|jgi:pectinesterase